MTLLHNHSSEDTHFPFFIRVSHDTGSISLKRQCIDVLESINLQENAFALAGGDTHSGMPAAFYLHVFHVLEEVHVRIMAVGQLDQIPEFRICWECLNEAGQQ